MSCCYGIYFKWITWKLLLLDASLHQLDFVKVQLGAIRTSGHSHIESACCATCCSVSTVVSILKIDMCLADQVVATDQIPVEYPYLEQRVVRKRRLHLEAPGVTTNNVYILDRCNMWRFIFLIIIIFNRLWNSIPKKLEKLLIQKFVHL